jgi:hypothetical protein
MSGVTLPAETFLVDGLLKYHVSSDFGHPWTQQAGFDVMFVSAKSEARLLQFTTAAKEKFWATWISGSNLMEDKQTLNPDWPFGAALYKPTGATARWQDVNGMSLP